MHILIPIYIPYITYLNYIFVCNINIVYWYINHIYLYMHINGMIVDITY